MAAACPRLSPMQRFLRRVLSPGRGEVRTMEESLHLAGVLRFIGLFGVTVAAPASLLAWFGLASAPAGPQELSRAVQAEAEREADAYWSRLDRRFSGFEQRVRDRLEAGRSPLDSTRELDPDLLVALRLDDEGQLVAPVIEGQPGGHPAKPRALVSHLFSPGLRAAEAAERQKAEPLLVARLYQQAAASAQEPAVEGRCLFDRARMLVQAGRAREADQQLLEVAERYGPLRDSWGVRLMDLSRLERAELLLQSDPVAGRQALRSLVEALLSEPWTLGEGAEAAVAQRALSLLEPAEDRDWVAVTRGRIAERGALLYQTGQLLPELRAQLSQMGGLRVQSGDIRWQPAGRAVWATTWFGGDLYAFGLDQRAIAATLREEMAAIGGQGSALAVGLFTAGERVPADVLEEKPLSPWLTGWTLAVWARDPLALRAAERRQGLLRNAAITIAVGMMGVGAFLILRLVKRELDVARMKTDFAASVSHELRSPITQIRLKGESLMLGLSETEEERQESYQAIVRESERLSRLVDNVLDFAAIERGAKRYTLRPDDLTETVYKAVDSISSAQEVADKELDVDLSPELPMVYHDPDAVAQCVINLVSNAAKYSSPGGWIGIRAAVVEDGVELSVEDRGIGIAAHDLPHLFEPFFRSRDSLARRRKGTGIGLTITRYIMRAHGGDIRVQSRPGHGSTFYLHFPLRPPAAADIGGPVGR